MLARFRSARLARRTGPVGFWLTYLLTVIFTFHTMLVAYSNSSYLEWFVHPEAVGVLYSIGSALAVIAFLCIAQVLRRVGNVKLTLGLAIAELLALLALGLANSPATAIVAFVIFLTLNPLLYLSIDIFSETLMGEGESNTGGRRGLALTLMSVAAMLAPLSMGALIGSDDSNLPHVYFASAGVFLLFIIVIVIGFDRFADPHYKELRVFEALRHFISNRDIRGVLFAHFLLQLFFAWIVIYFPLYLATEVGLTWDVIGSIIAFGLFAYVLLEYPIGIIADRYTGEKEMMALGFLVLAVTSASISFFAGASAIAWMALMFASRVGASLVEVTTESYFFKHVDGSDANVMSFFRLTRPLATLSGALLGSLTLLYLPFELIFVVLGFLMIPGIFATVSITDTK